MNVEPLHLTERERAVAQLVLNGHTKAEIARALDISPETVKKHTNNIVRKCGASNQKEAASVLYMHNYIYGPDGIGADFFVLTREVRVDIADDRRSSNMTANSMQVCCRDGITEKDGDVFCDGDIVSVEVDGREVVPLVREGGRLRYKDSFNPAIRRGQVINRRLRAELRDSFRFPSDYFFIEQPLPCRELRIEVCFGSSFVLSDVQFEARLGTHRYEPSLQDRTWDDRAIKWVIRSPKVLSSFTIRWTLKW